jgi:hypothetical protein
MHNCAVLICSLCCVCYLWGKLTEARSLGTISYTPPLLLAALECMVEIFLFYSFVLSLASAEDSFFPILSTSHLFSECMAPAL